MGKRKPISVLKRGPGQQDKRKAAQLPEQGSQDNRHKPSPAKEMPSWCGKQSSAPNTKGSANERRKADAERLNTAALLRPGAWEAVSVVDWQAARAVQQLLQADASGRKGASIKSLTLAPSIEAKKATHAVTCQTLKLLPVLKQLLEGCSLMQQNPQLQPETAYVLVYEALFGEGFRRRGPAEKAVLAAKGDLEKLLHNIKVQAGVEDVEALLSSEVQHVHEQQRPRTARVNTLKMSVASAVAWLSSPPPEHSCQPPQEVSIDDLLPDVLHFPSGTDLHDHPLVRSACLILQSKSSCMPAHALRPEPGWEVLDACAAPGNKTTHVAGGLQSSSSWMTLECTVALLEGQGRVLAFDRDSKRLARLKANVKAAAASNVEAELADFLGLPLGADTRFRDIRGALVDPSCSGSGTVRSRMDHLLPSFLQRGEPGTLQPTPQVASNVTEGDATVSQDSRSGSQADRIEKLASFQEAAVKHALLLPSLQRLVYSTCSVHEQENEAVVAAVLPDAKRLGFQLVDPFPEWHRRGIAGSVEGAEMLVRVDPYHDETDGFFIAVFQRVGI